MSNHDEKDLLTQEMRQRTADIGGHPISLGDVKGRARHIRRRRNAVTGAIAAVVAAVAIPTGMTVTTALDSPDSGRSPQVASSPSASVSPRSQGSTGLSMTGIPTGGAPQVPYLTTDPKNPGDDQMVTPNGVVHLDPALGPVQAAAPFGDGWQVLAYPGPSIVHLDAAGQIVSKEQYRAGDTMAVANDGSRVAYTLIDPDGGAQLLTSVPTSGNLEPNDWRLPAKPRVTPIGFVDNNTVVFQTEDDRGATTVYTAAPGQQPQRVQGLISASDAGDGLIVGTSKVDELEPAVCSAAISAATGARVWENCDYSLPRGSLSPNGQFLQANPGYVDGYGALSTSILDAATGEPVADYGQPEKNSQVTVLQQVWESDDTVLATLADGPEFGIVRLDVNGGIELAVPPVDGEAFGDAPFRFNAPH